MDRQQYTLSALDAIFTRRSVRAYTGERIDAATVRSLLDAAVQAPTAMHGEPWAFIVIQNAETLKRISDRAKGHWATEAARYRDLHPAAAGSLQGGFAARFAAPDFSIFYDAGTLIAICAKTTGPFVAADCWLAAENLMLAAAALGLGTCCIGSAVPALNSADTRTELSLAAGLEVIAPIVVGVAREPGQASGRNDPEIVCWQ